MGEPDAPRRRQRQVNAMIRITRSSKRSEISRCSARALFPPRRNLGDSSIERRRISRPKSVRTKTRTKSAAAAAAARA
ncbi:MAG: hypothetical protein DME06_04735 [Candidatus Rokuibacteriota bacterium]|nr:MAG: hypothetical protein DME06_04735 [Candidatus Rokubacteria bacterium]